MKEVKYYCDCCRKNIQTVYNIIIVIDLDNLDSMRDKKDLCRDCYYEIMKATYNKFQELRK